MAVDVYMCLSSDLWVVWVGKWCTALKYMYLHICLHVCLFVSLKNNRY